MLDIKNVITSFFRLQLSVKMLHWNTKNYNLHKITDKLHQNLIPINDRFVETYLGKNQEKPSIILTRVDIDYISDTELLAYLEKIIDKVILSDYYKNVENELRAIMDELLELLYTNIYLLRTVKI
jgi:DNA-binding ferritin-like protein